MFASKSTRGFYDPGINYAMPQDVVEITKERHAELLAGQSAGKVIDWDDQGQPVLIDPPPQRLAENGRAWRDAEVERVRWLRERHRDELDIGRETTLSVGLFAELLTYIQALRDWPQLAEFPDESSRPGTPDWIAEQSR